MARWRGGAGGSGDAAGYAAQAGAVAGACGDDRPRPSVMVVSACGRSDILGWYYGCAWDSGDDRSFHSKTVPCFPSHDGSCRSARWGEAPAPVGMGRACRLGTGVVDGPRDFNTEDERRTGRTTEADWGTAAPLGGWRGGPWRCAWRAVFVGASSAASTLSPRRAPWSSLCSARPPC